MNATLIAFPDNMDRSDREFDRTGSTDFTRAGDEATAIYDDMLAGADRAALLERVGHLNLASRLVGDLALRRLRRSEAGWLMLDVAELSATLPSGCG